MKVINESFVVEYDVKNITVVQVRKEGIVEGKKYGNEIQMRSTNLIEIDDDSLGSIYKEEILILKLIAESDELSELNKFFNQRLSSQNLSFKAKGNLAKGGSKGIYEVTAIETAKQLMQRLQEPKRPDTKKQHN